MMVLYSLFCIVHGRRPKIVTSPTSASPYSAKLHPTLNIHSEWLLQYVEVNCIGNWSLRNKTSLVFHSIHHGLLCARGNLFLIPKTLHCPSPKYLHSTDLLDPSNCRYHCSEFRCINQISVCTCIISNFLHPASVYHPK